MSHYDNSLNEAGWRHAAEVHVDLMVDTLPKVLLLRIKKCCKEAISSGDDGHSYVQSIGFCFLALKMTLKGLHSPGRWGASICGRLFLRLELYLIKMVTIPAHALLVDNYLLHFNLSSGIQSGWPPQPVHSVPPNNTRYCRTSFSGTFLFE